MLHAILSSLHRGFWGGDPFALVPYKDSRARVLHYTVFYE